mmetsp:Transcript_4434/g.28266  ORF Transcript_4434/g.28266 Transcript_4434/m.28266 type:complete len:99 (+) Transcript_4434:1441-1737(+)
MNSVAVVVAKSAQNYNAHRPACFISALQGSRSRISLSILRCCGGEHPWTCEMPCNRSFDEGERRSTPFMLYSEEKARQAAHAMRHVDTRTNVDLATKM